MAVHQRRRRSPAFWIAVIFSSTALMALLVGGGLFLLAREIADPTIVPENQVVRLVEKEDWDRLDTLAEASLLEPKRTPDGTWRVKQFYDSVEILGRTRSRVEMQPFLEKIQRWEQARPNSLAAKLMRTKVHYEIGWMVRGGGYASTVSESEWPIFEQHMDTAWVVAEPLTARPDANVVVYELLLSLGTARNLPLERMEALLAAGRALEPAYEPLYEAFTRYLLPRWHGEHGDVHKFAARMLEEEGEALYAHLGTYLWARESSVVQYMFYSEPLLQGMKALVENYPSNASYAETYLQMLFFYGDRQEAKGMLEKLPKWYPDSGENSVEWRNWLENDGPFPGLAKLHLLVLANDLSGLEAAAREGQPLEGRSHGNTPLTQAVEGFREACVGKLLELGANPETPDDEGRAPLLIAADYGQVESVRFLVQAGADVNAVSAQRWTALHYAARSGFTQIAKTLLEADDLRPNVVVEDGYTTPLLLAVGQGHEEVALALLSNARVNPATRTTNSLWTPLHYAVGGSGSAVLRALLAKPSVDVNARDDTGRTPLLVAVQDNKANAVRVLLQDRRVDVNARTDKDTTPLTAAAMRDYAEVVGLLLARDDLDVNAPSGDNGRTALHTAAFKGSADAVKLLLADPRIDAARKAKNGKTAADLAREAGHQEVVGLLERASAGRK